MSYGAVGSDTPSLLGRAGLRSIHFHDLRPVATLEDARSPGESPRLLPNSLGSLANQWL